MTATDEAANSRRVRRPDSADEGVAETRGTTPGHADGTGRPWRLAAPTALLITLLILVKSDVTRGVDGAVATRIHREALRYDLVADSAKLVTELGSITFLGGVLFVVTVCLLIRGEFRKAAWLVATSAAGLLSSLALKELVGRPRPSFPTAVERASGSSFPSVNTVNSTVVYFAIAFLAAAATTDRSRRRLEIGAAGVPTVLVGLSRIVIGVHWLTDVLAGMALGALVLSVARTWQPTSRAGA